MDAATDVIMGEVEVEGWAVRNQMTVRPTSTLPRVAFE
jgi:hypothetical protein